MPTGTFVDVTGQTFGHWTVLAREASSAAYALWRCRCVCGTEKLLSTASLRMGRPKSCGCKRGKHGHSKPGSMTPTYSSWRNMIARCTQASSPAFPYYRKNGIKVCARWTDPEHGYLQFLADMGERPSPLHTLDRWPDNFGDYEPGNCRWATKIEQANNRRTNIHFEFRGRTLTLAQLSRETGQSKETLRSRLVRNKHPWPIEEAVTRPVLTPFESRSRR